MATGARFAIMARTTIATALVALAMSGCANSNLTEMTDQLTTGSLLAQSSSEAAPASPTTTLADVTQVLGATSNPNRQRLQELFDLDRRCYSIVARDEVWRAFQAQQPGRLAPTAVQAGEPGAEPPPVADPWTPENRAFYDANCNETAQATRSAEMRALHL